MIRFQGNIFYCGLVFGIFVCLSDAIQITKSNNVSSSSSTPSTAKMTAINKLTVEVPKDGLNKRNIKIADHAAAKSYDDNIQTEYYRSRESLSSYSNRDRIRYNEPIDGHHFEPIAFPTDHRNPKEIGDWKVKDSKEIKNADRVSLGHHHTETNKGDSITSGTISFRQFPYDTNVGHSNDYNPLGHYKGGFAGDTDTNDGIVRYYEGSNGEGPFDENNYHRNKGYYHNGLGVSEYPYAYGSHGYDNSHHKHKGYELSHKAYLAKSFLIPLASAAVLGIAAALVSNPLLLQLGTVSGAAVGKRKRRHLPNPTNEYEHQKNGEQSEANSIAYRRIFRD